MNAKEKLIERFGYCKNQELTALDEHKLFAKNGISTVAALAGTGKTTMMLLHKKAWESKGYHVSHMNFDSAHTYGAEMIECPASSSEVEEMFEILVKFATQNDIIVIDSLKAAASYLQINIEDNSHMYDLMLKLKALAKATGCSIILIHHIYRPKNIKSHVDSFYGSRAIEEQSDSGFIFYGKHVKIVKSRLGHHRDKIIDL